MNIIRSRRFLSTTSKSSPVSDLAKILVIPITQNKSYIHFKFNENLINNDSLIVKYENKLSNIALKGWTRLKDSDKSYNQKIVHYVEKFLERTPWSENSLISIPSKATILRQAFEENNKDDNKPDSKPSILLLNDTDIELNNKGENLLNIPVYYPGSLMSSTQLKNELLTLSSKGQTYHKKQMILNGIGIPISLPFMLVPVIPNIPGFYLAYRLYCNLKAFLGAEHLEQIAKRGDLSFLDHEILDQIYSKQDKTNDILLNEEIINDLVKTFEIDDAKAHLLKALKQEKEALESKP
ncbi:hypothetical protein BN7_1878 [Wickerhamomyces ciferrii]|uniref:Uncharacterized protein n=1 Tax=Wickerhamomyces ciferrii (strain ATCC 14091 / BCRC 22168 / CBS 111 / JCM 3599 / NBRC 0793 / NRRL Y-1031 F-60-10) TaxID=1206466 RepID=K0KLW7_WICCF|nr:uncharacterized protein BN7_1878 [Wickerhamomyces ciferrii]CCH42334.1 hypothetical protein BN7_1878 [Wickerhamomyces ciferrii]